MIAEFGAEMFFNSASAIGDFSGKHTDAALHTLNHFGEDYESYKEQALEDPGSRGFAQRNGGQQINLGWVKSRR